MEGCNSCDGVKGIIGRGKKAKERESAPSLGCFLSDRWRRHRHLTEESARESARGLHTVHVCVHAGECARVI